MCMGTEWIMWYVHWAFNTGGAKILLIVGAKVHLILCECANVHWMKSVHAKSMQLMLCLRVQIHMH